MLRWFKNSVSRLRLWLIEILSTKKRAIHCYHNDELLGIIYLPDEDQDASHQMNSAMYLVKEGGIIQVPSGHIRCNIVIKESGTELRGHGGHDIRIDRSRA